MILYLALGGFCSGVIGMIIASMRGYKKVGGPFWLSFFLGPVGWILTLISRQADEEPAGALSGPALGVPASQPTVAPPAPGTAAGWLADPTGRYQHRYWDGGRWTEHVHDGSSQTTDPT